MHTTISQPHPATRRNAVRANASVDAFRQPGYDCQEHRDAMTLIVYVPGVAASGVDIEARGTDLTVTARKARFIRVNFPALHLENAQRDYRLKLRLGGGFDYAAMQAEIANGVLTLTLPKRAAETGARLRRVA
jgi:HSP20 family protein